VKEDEGGGKGQPAAPKEPAQPPGGAAPPNDVGLPFVRLGFFLFTCAALRLLVPHPLVVAVHLRQVLSNARIFDPAQLHSDLDFVAALTSKPVAAYEGVPLPQSQLPEPVADSDSHFVGEASSRCHAEITPRPKTAGTLLAYARCRWQGWKETTSTT
jgi:hypothetical protein